MALHVHHVAVLVSDLERAQAFYTNVLGLPLLRRHDDDAGQLRSVWVSLGDGAFLALEKASDAGPLRAQGAPGWHCMALTIDASDREVWRARLATAAIPIERESPFTLYARDPDGNLVALSHHPRMG
jgi:glyoxylase I family protein